MVRSKTVGISPQRMFDDTPKRVPAYLQFLLDITQEKREKNLYLLVGSGLPTLVRVHMIASKWESYTRLQCAVDEIEGVAVPVETRQKLAVSLDTVDAPTEGEQMAVLRQALARHNLLGRTVLAEDVEGHLRVAALRRRLKRS